MTRISDPSIVRRVMVIPETRQVISLEQAFADTEFAAEAARKSAADKVPGSVPAATEAQEEYLSGTEQFGSGNDRAEMRSLPIHTERKEKW